MTSKFEQHIIEQLKNTKLFIIDLDGTVYIDNKLISGVDIFINHLKERNISYLFLTNNSSKCANEYIHKLNFLGIPAFTANVLTSGQATGRHISGIKPNAAIYVIGTASLKKELAAFNLQIVENSGAVIDYVVAGFDTELSYEKIRTACRYLDLGASFIATNPDLVCPIDKNHFLPDCGSICALLESATGRKPQYIGKPHATMIEIICKTFTMNLSQMAIIGDRLYTDIALGINAGIFSICVLSGETSLTALEKSPFRPDIVVESINSLNDIFA
jgi:NagD protein